MTLAYDHEARCEAFTTAGRCYVWHEGPHALAPQARRMASRRDELATAFSRTVLPGLERRNATARVFGAGSRGGSARAYWVLWEAPGDAQPVWALYVPTRRLAARVLGDVGRPANDGALLAAWGDGPVLAWASERPAVREVLREALRALPGFLGQGLASADVTLPLRIVAA